ncbi:MAG: YkgJ family cysteine cluster protein [Candidatus Saganbacteria bacterium]|nr:YkgJ family cysteine cluster protein [Candidatus Saganbacteria bacterium]
MRLLKRFIMCFIILDNLITTSLKRLFGSRYKLQGSCKKCGQCCREIYLKMTRQQYSSFFFREIAVRWISWIFDFEYIRTDDEVGDLVFRCKNQLSDGRCGNYFWRPNICRNFPLVDYFEEPKLLPGCGYTFCLRR